MSVLAHLFMRLATLDPNMGAPAAQQGAVQRLAEPNIYDMIFPGIAFGLVIVLPVSTALWVLYRTVKDNTKEPDEV